MLMIRKLYEDIQKRKKNSDTSWRYFYKLNKLLINVIYPIIGLCASKTGVDESSDVVVSLASYTGRIRTAWITVATLLNQTYKPRAVVLYLALEQFPGKHRDLPRSLLRLQKRGLTIRFVDKDLKPHKKYYYAFREYPDCMVITADDDIFYPEDHIERFVAASRKYPDAVICDWSHKIDVTRNDGHKEFAKYVDWPDNNTDEPDIYTLAVGCNGVLYKPSFFDEEVFNEQSIIENALFTDDLWLKIMELKNGVKVYNCSNETLIYFNNVFTLNTGLWHVNASNNDNRNDMAWRKLLAAYPEVLDRL